MLPWETPYGRDLVDLNVRLSQLEHKETGRVDTFPANLDVLLYRHWHVAYAMRHALAHAGVGDAQAAECGVAEGLTAYIACVQGPVTMHLYDPWGATRASDVSSGERDETGYYGHLDIARTKRNLARFADRVVFHPGYIPESFDATAPRQIIYLHIDINAARPTEAALAFFWPRLVPGGVILFDYYGWLDWIAIRNVVDGFFAGKPGTMMPLPTGQAIYFR